jgi:hypothetical protein
MVRETHLEEECAEYSGVFAERVRAQPLPPVGSQRGVRKSTLGGKACGRKVKLGVA